MAKIVTRAGKGSPLTWNDMDSNFINLNNDKQEDLPNQVGQNGKVLGTDGTSLSWVSPGGGGTVPFKVITTDYGAVGDGVTNDSAAFLAAEAAGETTFIPSGTYKINSAVDAVVPFVGLDVTLDQVSPNTYLHNFTDFGKKALYRRVYRTASEYTTKPVTYSNLYAFSGMHLEYYSTMGYQQKFTDDSGGRTMQAGYSLDGSHSGYGDVCSFYGNYGISKHPSYNSVTGWTGANSGTVVGGQVSALTERVNVYGTEVHLTDNGYKSVAAIGAVYDFARTSVAYDYNTLWAGVRVQTSATKPIDVGFQLAGKAQVGLDFSGVDFELLNGSASKYAIALKGDDRIYFNVGKKAPPIWHAVQDTFYPETYMVFDKGQASYNFVHDGVVSFRTNKAATVIQGGTAIYKSGNLIADFCNADSSKIFLGRPGVTVSINQRLNLSGQTISTSATGGSAAALPSQPFTYLTIDIDGTIYKIPVYNA